MTDDTMDMNTVSTKAIKTLKTYFVAANKKAIFHSMPVAITQVNW